MTYRSSETRAQTAATSVVVPLPGRAKVEPSDLLLIAINVAGGSGVTITPPARWLSIVGVNDGTAERLEVFRYRVDEDGVPADPTFTFSLSAACVCAALSYGGVDDVTLDEASAGQANGSSTAATAPAVTTVTPHAGLVAFWAAATGARTATPPTGMKERLDVAGAALSLSSADQTQVAAGSSGTKVATLSGASTNVGVLLSLKPAILNTVSNVRDEGGWRYEAFAPRVDDDTEMEELVARVLQQQNRELFRRVGARAYAKNVLYDPHNAILAEAEMHLAQAAMLQIAAGLAPTADDREMLPYAGNPRDMRAVANERKREALQLIATLRGSSSMGPSFAFRSSQSSGVGRRLFDETDGIREDQDDD